MVDKAKAFLRVVSKPGEAPWPLIEGAQGAFPEGLAARWLRACRKLADAGYGEGVVMAYRQHSIAIAELIGPEAALDMVDTVSVVAIKAGRRAASTLSWAATKAAAKFT